MTNDDDFKKARDEAAAEHAAVSHGGNEYQRFIFGFDAGATWAREYCAKEYQGSIDQRHRFARENTELKLKVSELKSAILDLAGALEDAENDLAVRHDDIVHCMNHECLPTNDELKRAKADVDSVRHTLKTHAPLLKRLRER